MKHHVIAQVGVHGEILLIFLVPSYGDNLRSEAYEVKLPNQLPTIHFWDLEIDEHEVDAYHTKKTEAFLCTGGYEDNNPPLAKSVEASTVLLDRVQSQESLHAIPLFIV